MNTENSTAESSPPAKVGRVTATSAELTGVPINGGSAVSVQWYESVWTWFWMGLLAGCLPILAIYFSRMWRLPHYQYFPFAILAVGWLAWTRSDRRFHPPANLVSLSALGLGFAVLTVGWTVKSPWMYAIVFVLFATACLASMRDEKGWSLLPLALPLALLIRLPLGYDQILVIKLQEITTALSSLFLDIIGVPHSVEQNILQLPGRELFVAEACSGIQSVFTLAFLSTLMVVFFRRRIWLAPIYLGIALLLAVAGNVLRVTTVAIADNWMQMDLATGWAHDLLGYTTLGIAVLFLLSFDQMIMGFLHPMSRTSGGAQRNPLIRVWNWLVDDGTTVDLVERYYRASDVDHSNGADGKSSWWGPRGPLARGMETIQSKAGLVTVVGLAIVLFGMTTARAFSVKKLAFEGGTGMFIDGLLWNPPPDIIESVADGFALADRQTIREGENPILGNNADSWVYERAEGIKGSFVISQTYSEFHELCFCYEIRDWSLLDRSRRDVSDPGVSEAIDSAEAGGETQATDSIPPVAYALFKNDALMRGYLWYGSVSASGKIPTPPEKPGRLGSRLTDAFEEDDGGEPIMMIQLWVTSDEAIAAKDLAQITEDFAVLRSKIAQEVTK